MKALILPENETAAWVLGHPVLCEATIGRFCEERGETWEWEVKGQMICYLEGAALELALELADMADQLRDMGSFEGGWTKTAPATAGLQAKLIERWSMAVRP